MQIVQKLFQFCEFQIEINWRVTARPRCNVAVPVIIQVEISAADAMLVQVDAIHASHVHETGAAQATQSGFQRLPVRFHNRSVRHCCAGAGCAFVCKYIWFNSLLSCISSRNSSRLGILLPERLTLFVSTERMGGLSPRGSELDFSSTLVVTVPGNT